MSVIHSIAYGLVTFDEMIREQRKRVHKVARDEAYALGYWISGCKHAHCCDPKPQNQWTARGFYDTPPHKLTRWNKNTFKEHRRYQRGNKPGVTGRVNPLAKGTFAECCRALTNHITIKPSCDEVA